MVTRADLVPLGVRRVSGASKEAFPLFTEIRKRKGPSPEPVNPAEFIDKE